MESKKPPLATQKEKQPQSPHNETKPERNAKKGAEDPTRTRTTGRSIRAENNHGFACDMGRGERKLLGEPDKLVAKP